MAQSQGQYHRPIGVTLLAIGAGLAALAELWRMLVFLGVVNFTFVGKSVSFHDPQWGQALWALILAAIWIWVAMGFWNVRAYAVQFGIFISLFTLVFGFMALLFGSSIEAETVPWLLAGAIFLYLSYPGVQKNFVEHELSMMTPAQRAAMEQMQAANAAVIQANTAPAPVAPAAAPVAAPVAVAAAVAAPVAAPVAVAAAVAAPAAPPEPVAAPVAVAAAAAAEAAPPEPVTPPVVVAAAPVAPETMAPEPVEAPVVVAAAAPEEPQAARHMLIVEVEGIGPAYAEKLAAAGIKTTDDLLTAGAKPQGREKIAEGTGISEKLILGWVNKVDLMRVPGVGPQYSDLLEAAGVDSPAELSHRNAANLADAVQSVVAERPGIVRRTPTEMDIAAWIEEAGKLAKVVEH